MSSISVSFLLEAMGNGVSHATFSCCREKCSQWWGGNQTVASTIYSRNCMIGLSRVIFHPKLESEESVAHSKHGPTGDWIVWTTQKLNEARQEKMSRKSIGVYIRAGACTMWSFVSEFHLNFELLPAVFGIYHAVIAAENFSTKLQLTWKRTSFNGNYYYPVVGKKALKRVQWSFPNGTATSKV